MFILIKVTNNIPKVVSFSRDKSQIVESAFKRIEKFLQRALSEQERDIFRENFFFETFECDPTTFSVFEING